MGQILKLKYVICIVSIVFSILAGGISAYITVKCTWAKQEEKMNLTNNKKNEEISEDMIPIKAELTAYCNCEICFEEWGSQTAMMTETKKGVVAAPDEIPLGSTLYIPELKNYKNDGIFFVEDRGGAVKVKDDGTYIIDIWLSNHEDVIKFGRKKCTVYLIKSRK